MNWSSVFTSQRLVANEKHGVDSASEPLERGELVNTSVLDSGLQNCGKILLFVIVYYSSHRKLIHIY